MSSYLLFPVQLEGLDQAVLVFFRERRGRRRVRPDPKFAVRRNRRMYEVVDALAVASTVVPEGHAPSSRCVSASHRTSAKRGARAVAGAALPAASLSP